MDEAQIRRALDAERETTSARIDAMTADFEGIVSASADTNGDDEHDPEGSTIAYERAQTAALLSDARGCLGDLDRAVARLDAGGYSVCDGCGGQIPSDRLAARPAARTCVRCVTALRPE